MEVFLVPSSHCLNSLQETLVFFTESFGAVVGGLDVNLMEVAIECLRSFCGFSPGSSSCLSDGIAQDLVGCAENGNWGLVVYDDVELQSEEASDHGDVMGEVS